MFNPFRRKKFPPPVVGIFLPAGCTREGDMIIVGVKYSAQWLKKYPDKVAAVTKMLAFLKSQYPAISKFRVMK